MSWRRNRARICASAFERGQKRARSRTDEHSLTYPSTRTNGRRFVYQNFVTAESWFCLTWYRTASEDAHARRGVIAKVAMRRGWCLVVGLIGVLLLAQLTGCSACCWIIDMRLCCLLTRLSFCLETCIQSFICEVCIVSLELLFPISNIYLFL
jgi:hypothetical protein